MQIECIQTAELLNSRRQWWKLGLGEYKQDGTWNLSYCSPPCAIYVRSINLFSKFQRLRLSVQATAAAKAENTSQYRKTPAACQPGEQREGVARSCEGEVRTAPATSLVSARGQAPAQTACLSPAGPAHLPLGPSRKSQHDSKLPGPGEWGAPPPPLKMCQWTHTHSLGLSLWTVRQPTPCCTWAYIGRRPS